MFGALLDASVLIPAVLADFFLRAAEAELYRPYWSDDILEEVRRNLVQDGFTTEAGAQRRVKAMRASFPAAAVEGYGTLIASMANNHKDRHVLAAAVMANARFIVTANLRHFPPHALVPHRIEALSPDEFLFRLDDTNHFAMATILRQQASDLRRPPVSARDIIVNLAIHAPRFATRLMAELDDSEA